MYINMNEIKTALAAGTSTDAIMDEIRSVIDTEIHSASKTAELEPIITSFICYMDKFYPDLELGCDGSSIKEMSKLLVAGFDEAMKAYNDITPFMPAATITPETDSLQDFLAKHGLLS